MSEENKKEEVKSTWGQKIAEGLGTMLLIIIGVVIFVWIFGPSSDSGSSSTAQVEKQQNINRSIAVTQQNMKQVDGKYRWFYSIKNNGATPFTGEVTIYLVNGLGKNVYDDTFSATSPIQPGISKTVYLDTSTGPASVHGENGISSYKFTAYDN